MKFNFKKNWKLKNFLLAIIIMQSFFVLQAQAQTSVKGKITGDGGPLPGVSVLVKGTKTAVSTDFDGNYTINAKATDVLIFSYLGFQNQEQKIAARKIINLEMKTEISALDEVVIVGYGTQKKKEITQTSSNLIN